MFSLYKNIIMLTNLKTILVINLLLELIWMMHLDLVRKRCNQIVAV